MSRITAWRVTHRKYAGTALSGEGARLAGGRFNSTGVAVVYCSATLSLAVLEILAQANRRRRITGHVCIPVSFSEDHTEVAGREDLPEGWNALPVRGVSQMFGDAWVKEQRSMVLRVPSVVIPSEFNYVLNPAHPAFDSLEVGDPMPLPFDARLAAA